MEIREVGVWLRRLAFLGRWCRIGHSAQIADFPCSSIEKEPPPLGLADAGSLALRFVDDFYWGHLHMIVNYYRQFLSYSDLSIDIHQLHCFGKAEGPKVDKWEKWTEREDFGCYLLILSVCFGSFGWGFIAVVSHFFEPFRQQLDGPARHGLGKVEFE